MRPDQIERLRELSENLADTFLLEADPGEWPGDGKSPADISQQERGDRYWSKKNAMATGGVLRYTLDLLRQQVRPGSDLPDADADADMDAKIKDAEFRASVAVARVMDKAKGKAEFDRRVQGNG